MFGVLKVCGLIHNHSREPYTFYEQWPGAKDILDAATQGGAAALGLSDRLGKLAPGQLADIVLLDLDAPSFFPLHDPYLHLVYCEQGESVDTVIVHGQVVVQHGVVQTVDEAEIRREARTLCEELWSAESMLLTPDPATREVMKTFVTLHHLLLSHDEHS
jgi:cytosine/adenosine deaminase-related metal-dependent hydrolase